MRNADVAALRMYCKMAIDVNGLPNMQKLGRKMLDDHAATRKCVCVCSRVHATSPLDVCILYAICLVSQSACMVSAPPLLEHH